MLCCKNFVSMHNFSKYVLSMKFKLFIWQAERERENKRVPLSTGSFPRSPLHAGLGQVELEQQTQSKPSCRCKEPSLESSWLLPQVCFSRKPWSAGHSGKEPGTLICGASILPVRSNTHPSMSCWQHFLCLGIYLGLSYKKPNLVIEIIKLFSEKLITFSWNNTNKVNQYIETT